MEVDAFIVLVAVLFGSTLFGVIGAVLAILTAASIQIATREWFAYRREVLGDETAQAPPPTGEAEATT